MNDSTLITISWDTTTETHTVAALREKFASTNLFHEDGTWELTAPAAKSYTLTMASLEDVLDLLEDSDEWTCDNCTVSLAEETQSESFQWNEDGTLNKYPDEPVNVLADHDWNDMDDDADMLDSIISMLDGFDADRMASYLMGVQDALAGKTATNGEASDYAAGHGRIMECIDATIAATVDVQDQLNGGAQ